MSDASRILVVDDDKNICELVRLYLKKDGYDVITANDGHAALKVFRENKLAAVILDIMLPGIDGIDVLKEMRKTSSIPVIMLTAKGETLDKVLGLELGADDYMVKPFEPKELIARIKAVLRRFEGQQAPVEENGDLEFKGLKISRETYEVYLDDKKIEMPPKEFELLYFLAKNKNKVYTRDQLLDEIWGYEFFGDSRTVDVHIKRIREKLESENKNWQLKTVWGVGYKFETEDK